MKKLITLLTMGAAMAFAAPAMAAVPPVPTNLQIVTQTINGVRDSVLTWNTSAGATSYVVTIDNQTINVQDPHQVFSSDTVTPPQLVLGSASSFHFGYTNCGMTSEISYSVQAQNADGKSASSAVLNIFPGC